MSSDKMDLEAAGNSWVPYGNGYEMTQSRQIIASRLLELKQRKLPVVLVHKNYQSGQYMLVGFEKSQILIDKPPDWPGTESKIRVIYRDRNNLWNHFFSTVVSTSSDTLYLSPPTHFFLLQRREHYRVDTPSGSLASFIHKNDLHADILVKDLSACGMLLVSPQQLPFQEGAVIEEIMLTVPVEEEPYPVTLLCQGGEVIRVTSDQRNRQFLLGIKFQTTDEEEEAILRYVRQREIELLRKVVDAGG